MNQNPNIKEIIAAVPEELQNEQTKRAINFSVPVNGLYRAWIFGSLQTKIVAGYLSLGLKNLFKNKTAKEKSLHETHLVNALKVLGGMNYLRGAVMKIGQTLSNVPDILPDEYIDTLKQLQFQAPPMHFSLMRELFIKETGYEPEELFAEFDTNAFAAASFGQVHKAKLKTGETVAVKIQYPNIARTVQKDFQNLKTILFPLLRLSKDWQNIREKIEDAFEMVRHETDYMQEAENLEKAFALFKPEDGIQIPKVYQDYCTSKILTMEYLDGIHLDDYLKANPTQAERNHFGYLINKSAFRMQCHGKLLNTDPHPGNYLFLKNGNLGVLDFGSTRHFSNHEWDYLTQLDKHILAGCPEDSFETILAASMAVTHLNQIEPERKELISEYYRWLQKPLLHDGKFNFGDKNYLQDGIKLTTEIFRKRYLRALPLATWMNRYIMGNRALLYRLNCHVDMKSLYRDEAMK